MSGSAMSVEEVEKIMQEIELDDKSGRPAVAAPKVVNDNSPALREFVNPEQLQKDVEFNVNDLDNAVQQHASMFVHYSNMARLAGRQYERMKAAFEIMESRLDHAHRTKMKEENTKVTDKAIEAAVKSDPRWWAANQRLIDAKAIYELAKDARSAFDHRRDMIVQTSVDRRKEREGELRISAAKAGVADDRERALQAASGASKTLAGMLQK